MDKKHKSCLCSLKIYAFMQNNIILILIDLAVNSSNTNFKPESMSPQPGVSINSIYTSLID